jgi:hypothetical protein
MDACPQAPSVRDKMQSGSKFLQESQTCIERASFELPNVGMNLLHPMLILNKNGNVEIADYQDL